MSFCLRSWLTGFALGLSGAPYPYSHRAPVAFLYNGVRLPALPEWDREMYPYAAIGNLSAVYWLYFSTVPLTYRNVIPTIWYFDAVENGETLVYQTTTDTMHWEEQEPILFTAGQAVPLMPGKPCWTNHDINHSISGNLMLAASDPVPVYE